MEWKWLERGHMKNNTRRHGRVWKYEERMVKAGYTYEMAKKKVLMTNVGDTWRE